MAPETKPYHDFNSFLRRRFGCRVQKITVDAGFTCPNRDGTVGRGGCIYCNARGSGTGAASRGETISHQINAAKFYLAKRYKARKFLAYFQSFSNTYAPLQQLAAAYEEALSVPDVVGLAIGTRPDCASEEILDHLQALQQNSFIQLEYGLQSAHDRSLETIRRGHDVAAFVDAVQRTRARAIPVCAHVILGLPGESLDDMMETALFLAGLDVQAVKLHLLYVIRGTVLHRWHQAGRYRCLSREDYARATAEFLARLPEHIVIQRITGDPHREELVAPSWALEKQKNIQAIHEHMKRHGIHQGKLFPHSS